MKRYGISELTLNLITCFFVLYFTLSQMPYIVWETYRGGVFSNIAGVHISSVFGFLAVVMTILYVWTHGIRIVEYEKFIILFTIIIPIFTVVISGGMKNVFSSEWFRYVLLFTYFLLPLRIKYKLYKICYSIFVFTLIPALVYYFISRWGVALPFEILDSYEPGKRLIGVYYKLYPLSAQMSSIYGNYFDYRITGIYDEPGRLGTLAGLFLICEEFKIKNNWQNMVIFVSGLLSFSLAFWGFVLLYLLSDAVRGRKTKRLAYILSIPLIYFIFINLNFSSFETLDYLQRRVSLFDNTIRALNRTTIEYEMLYQTLYLDGWESVLFGKGAGAFANLQDDSIVGFSYKSIIFDYGYIGFCLQILWFVVIAYPFINNCNEKVRSNSIIILLAFLANFYQRPTFLYLGYTMIYYGALLKTSYGDLMNKVEIENK